jgi:arylsulfatase A-like enzyme
VPQIESTFAAGKDWLGHHGRSPFFLFLHTYQVHDPYTPPKGYLGMFGPANAQGPKADLDRYEEEIRYTDDQVAALWKFIESRGLADHTLMVVLSDHGEEFGEHGALKHGSDLYDETVLVPLILHGPSLIGTGIRVPVQVGLIDVLPTLLELMGLPPTAQAEGRSLAALARGTDADGAIARELEARPLYLEAWGGLRVLVDGSMDDAWHRPSYGSRRPAMKVLRTMHGSAPTIEAYDLVSDPSETRNLYSDATPRFAKARDELDAYVRSNLPPNKAAEATLPPPDAATEEKLRALGYVK